MNKAFLAAAFLLTAGAAAQAQDAPQTVSSRIVYPRYYEREFRLIDPQSAATATGADQVSREDTRRPPSPQEKPAMVYFHRKPKHKA